MIEDKELRDLFKIECSDHIQKLSDGLLRLEKEPKDSAILQEVFREAHSLKGAARMVGVSDVEAIAHKFEDILGAAKGGKTVLTSEVIDRLYGGLDSIQRLVSEAVSGEKAGVNVREILDFGLPISDLKPPKTEEQKAELKEEVKSEIEEKTKIEEESKIQIPKSKIDGEAFRVETVRVDTKMLDMLMTEAGELSVTKTHIARRIGEFDEIIESAEELEKTSAESGIRNTELTTKIQNLKSKIAGDSARLDFIVSQIEDGIIKIRLVPLSSIFNLYPRMVRDMARKKSKDINLVIEGGDTSADKRIIEEMKDPLMHLIRNAVDHGIEMPDERVKAGKPRTGAINIRALQIAGNIVIEVSDDGKGLDMETIKQTAVKRNICRQDELASMTPCQTEALIFKSGFSTSAFITDVSGRGVGLDVVRINVERLKGTIELENNPGKGCGFRLKLPITLATVRVMIVEVDKRNYAIPVESITTSRFVFPQEIFPVAGGKTITHEGEAVSVARLADLLEVQILTLPLSPSHQRRGGSYTPSPLAGEGRGEEGKSPCLILSVNNEKIGLIVDDLIDEQEIVLKPQSAILKHVRNVSGATILATGEVCTVLDPNDLLKSIRKMETPAASKKPEEAAIRKKSILVAEDSITTRTQEKRILEGAGYEVVTAVDGLDALNKINSRPFDAVVSDILMPNMDGLTLTERIRQDKRFKELPVILITTLASDEDRKRGLEAGANAYIAKPTFDQKVLLEILGRLV